ncbi:MAG: hypothetical protein A2W93_09275 [Bacteroidetes bacterium GWF2_43_63]|nr:MAG: hypothetical protein A2W94_05655 [Bacteroidetes bacterium GWE2_42_42]OFY54487.1 MAG: hypothetical protein A2W93_09275 [Bacteroidetes bacterium GWF2_43_63]HBG70436.1 hypothetical protein [Bacteroidales bacterium]HCB63447.1 hypothetical protein [Bacteroidales bacterium]
MKQLFFSFLLLLLIQAEAQLSTEKRIEFDLRNGYSGETIYESTKGYFVLESQADDDVDGQKEIKYDLYSGDLELEKTETVLVPRGMRFSELYYNDDFVYNMYLNKKGEFVITGVQMNTLDISKTTGVMPPKAFPRSMKVLGDQAWFLASVKKAPVIYRVDLGSGKGTAIPINIGAFTSKKLSSENYQILEKSNEILLFARASLSKTVSELHMIRISENDNVEKAIKISGAGDNSIVSISGCRVNDSKIIITGTYAKKGLMSEGLFFGEIEDGAINYIRYYNFLDLKDFLSYLPEKKQEKIEKKKAKKEAQGKEMSLDYWIADHDVIVLEDGYLFLGEAYYPTYRTETRTTVGANGAVSTYTVTVFDGYQYTHATLGKFSKQGELMWDVCFELNPGYKPFSVNRFIAISEQTASQISMVYTSRNEIVSKTVDFDGNILSDEKWDFIETGDESEKTKRTFSNVDYWYGNYFLAYGSQVVKNGKEKRKVYFVNKIGF